MLAELLVAMVAPNEPLINLQSAELRRVLYQLWQEDGKDLTIDRLAEVLKAEEDGRLQDLGKQLFPFTTQGQYGRYFTGKNTINFEGNFLVLELEELRGRKHLQQVVLLQLIYQIQQAMFLGDRGQKKLVVIDEAWDLLTQGNTAKFIETGFRRFRKYGGAAIVVTQSINDLYASAGGEAIAENSAVKILLGQTSEAISRLEETKRLDLGGEFGYSLLKTLHTVPGKYSELCIVTENGIGVGRLYVEPYKKYLYSTRASDIQAIKNLQAQGMGLMEAIDSLLAQPEQQTWAA
jgi:conjugal transfer ATP-binding protein TraC